MEENFLWKNTNIPYHLQKSISLPFSLCQATHKCVLLLLLVLYVEISATLWL